MKTNKRYKKLHIVVALLLAFTLAFNMAAPVKAAPTPYGVAAKVRSAVGKSNYPFNYKNSVTSKRKVFGVKVSDMSKYIAYEKVTGSGKNQVEYILFIGQAKSKAKAKSARTALKSYISNEAKSMNSYLSSTGKKVFKNAQVSYSGKWVWVVMLKSSSVNKKAVKAIKKAV